MTSLALSYHDKDILLNVESLLGNQSNLACSDSQHILFPTFLDDLACLNYILMLFCCSFCTAWEPFRDHIPEDERQCFISAYSKRLNADDVETQVRFIIVHLDCCFWSSKHTTLIRN